MNETAELLRCRLANCYLCSIRIILNAISKGNGAPRYGR
eukprot:SAG31_NODE_16567_length_704_cov_0.717355_1_plen_38_part_10